MESASNHTPTFQPPLVALQPQQLTSAQRLTIAQAEWNKLLAQRSTIAPVTRRAILSSENYRTNQPWGDTIGDSGPNITRIYSLNVNGLSIDRRGGRFDDLCKVAKEVKADVICGQEHNLDTTRSQVRSVLYDTARQHWDRSRLILGTTPIPFDTNYKPGGQ